MANSIALVDGNVISNGVATAATAGQVLSTDGTNIVWSTPTSGTGTAGQVAYWGSTSALTGNSFMTTNNSALTLIRADDNYANPYLNITNGNGFLRFFLGGDQPRISASNNIRIDANLNMQTGRGIYLSNVGIYTGNTRTAMLVTENNEITGTRTSAVTLGESLGNSGSGNILGFTTNWRTGLTVNSQARLDGQSVSLGMIGSYFVQTITAPANNSFLAGVVIKPSFSNGAFTGVTNVALGIENSSGYSIYQTGTAPNYMAANVLLGTLTDNGTDKLQVNGGTLLKGAGNTSATNALTVQNSSSVLLLSVNNAGGFFLGNSSGVTLFSVSSITGEFSLTNHIKIGGANGTSFAIGGRSLVLQGSNLFANVYSIYLKGGSGVIASGTQGGISTDNLSFSPTSGNAIYNVLNLTATINQTGGANGVTRGLYVNPTLTSAADWRSIEWSNNSGWGLYGAGTANNYLAGSLGIGTTSFAGMNLRVSKAITGNGTGRSVYLSGDFQSDVSVGYGVQTSFGTQATTFTLSDLIHFQAAQGTKGAGSTIGTQIAFDAAAMTNGSTNIAFRGQNASGTNVWNLYMNGTAANYLNGALLLGSSTTSTGEQLQVTGTAKITGATVIETSLGFGTDQFRATIFAGGASNRGIVINDNAGGTANVALLNVGNSSTVINGGKPDISLTRNFTPSTTAQDYTKLSLSGTYTELAGGNLTRGILINTTIGTTTNYRAIEWTNNNGWGLYGSGTAPNYLGGALTVNSQITSGNAQATAGSSVIRSTYSSGNLSNIGTNGSSGGISINYAAYNASTSTADTYLSGVGFASFARSSYIVQADHRWLTAASATVAEGSAVTLTEKMRLYNSGNLVIQDGGTYSDAGQKLQVYGDTLLKGSGNTSGSTALLVQNSDAISMFRVSNDGIIRLGNSGGDAFSAPQIYPSQPNSSSVSLSGSTLNFSARNSTVSTTIGAFYFSGTVYTATSGANQFINLERNFEPTSGTAVYNMLQIRPSINQTGGANGITRGLYVNPNLALGSGAADWRSIEWSNNTGYGLYGAGSAQNLLNGKLTVSPTITTANFVNANTMGVFAQQLLNVPAGNVGAAGNVYSAKSGFHYFRFNGNTTLNGDSLWAASIAVPNIQFDTSGTISTPDGAGGGSRPRALSGMQIQMQYAGANNGTIERAAAMLIQGCYPIAGAGVITFDEYAGIRINNLTEFGTANITMTERWGIYQAGANDMNHFNGAVLIGTATSTGEKLQVSGTMKVTGAVNLSGLPTSAAGLSAGDLWNDLGTVKIA